MVKECKVLVVELFRLLNANQASCLPSTSKKYLLAWLSECSKDSENQRQFLYSILSGAGDCLNRPQDLADLMEAGLECFFREPATPASSVATEGRGGDLPGLVAALPPSPTTTSWNSGIVSLAKLPQKQDSALLEHCVSNGYCLTLYLSLLQRRPLCKSVRDEEVLLSSLLDWIRHLNLRLVVAFMLNLENKK